jgi:MoxR-like ATPase/Mg-chelatase subunit ChlD
VNPVRQIQEQHGIVGREDELALALAVLESGRHLLLEGPVGVGKTTVALAVCDHLGRDTVRVDGDDRYSEAKLTGWFDPPLVLSVGYGEESFNAGPLVAAMRAGAVLFINELNRMPETVQNVLLPALDERRIGVPHLGEVIAAPGFQVIATQNPVEYVATGHLSEALRDRFEHLALVYQDEAEEEAIVAVETRAAGGPPTDPALVAIAVRLARSTRSHPRIRKGASVRAAIATVQVATRLGEAAGVDPARDPALLRRAAAAAFKTRIDLRDEAGPGFDAVLGELVERALAESDAEVRAPPPGDDDLPDGDPGEDEVDVVPVAPSASVKTAPRELRGRDGSPIDGWELAARLTAGKLAHADVVVVTEAERLATAAVLRRAGALVGPLRARTRLRRSSYEARPHAELDVAGTLENIAGKRYPDAGDWVVEHREEERRQVVLMVDTSGSMAGEPMALASVAAAVLALKVRPGDLGVVGFADDARDVVMLGEQLPVEEVVRRLLDRPCLGATNIEAALEAGERQLARTRNPRSAAVLVSDGQYTAGGDPRTAAARIERLHVLHTKTDEPGRSNVWINPVRQVGPDVARLGGGSLVPVRTFDELPARMLDLADGLLR